MHFRPVLPFLLRASLLAGFVTACDHAPPPREFDGASAFTYLQTQVAFGPRIPGTEGHRRMAAWLDSTLRGRADTLIVQSWTHVTARGRHPAADELPGPVQPRCGGAAALPGPLGHPPPGRRARLAGIRPAGARRQ